MGGRGSQTFKKRQKEQQRKERQQEKFAKRMQRKLDKASGHATESEDELSPAAETDEAESSATDAGEPAV